MIKALILQERPLELQEPPLANAPSLESWLCPNPASQVNRREFAHFRVRLHPHSFPLPLSSIPGKTALAPPAAASAAAAGAASPAAPGSMGAAAAAIDQGQAY